MAPPHANDNTTYNAKLLSEKLSIADIDVGSVEIPAAFKVAPENRPKVSHDSWADVPVLDLSEAETDEAGLAKKMVDALGECGLFSFINHGVPMELIDEVRAEGIKFFSLPLEEKRKIGQVNTYAGYSGDYQSYNSNAKQLLWKEALQMDLRSAQPEEFSSKVWPEGGSKFSLTIRNYVAEVQKARHYIFQLLAVGLGIPRDYFAKHFTPQNLRDILRWNYYPTCPRPMEVMGSPGHTDTVTMTILHDGEVGGLQIQMNGEWKGIKPVPGALVCNVGDLLTLWSNNRFKSAVHRVVCNDTKPRMSTVVFTNPHGDCVISSPSGIAEDVGKPRLYKDFTMNDFSKAFVESISKAKAIPGQSLNYMMETFVLDTVDDSLEHLN